MIFNGTWIFADAADDRGFYPCKSVIFVSSVFYLTKMIFFSVVRLPDEILTK